jgi:hypothetical protein
MADRPPAEVIEPESPEDEAARERADSDAQKAQETTAASTRRMPLRRLLWLAGGVAAVVALAVAGFLTWQSINADGNVLTQVAGTQITKDPQHPGLVTFTDPETRFRLDFPASWQTRQVGGADVRLLAGPGNDDLISVRVDTLDTGSSSPPTTASLKPYLDTIIQEPTVKVVQQAQIAMDHLPGWYYVYTFTDSTTHAEGIHAQYFIVRGNQLYSIVFQALPATDFSKMAATYQQIANSIRFY